MTTATKERPLVNGHPIHLRGEQQLMWTGMSILLGAGFIAGLYWIILQQDYTHLGFAFHGLKTWWDSGMGFIHSGNWAAYRHGIRDGGEPAAWTMIGATILGKVKTNTRLLPLGALFVAPFILLALIVAGTLGITWVTHFGPLSHVNDALSWQQILLGVILGRLLHLLWAPIGNTVRFHLIAHSALYGTRTPLWVSLPLLPPAWREGWAELRAKRAVNQEDSEDAEYREEHRFLLRILIPLAVLVFVLVAVIGNIAKYLVAHGVHVPVMNP